MNVQQLDSGLMLMNWEQWKWKTLVFTRIYDIVGGFERVIRTWIANVNGFIMWCWASIGERCINNKQYGLTNLRPWWVWCVLTVPSWWWDERCTICSRDNDKRERSNTNKGETDKNICELLHAISDLVHQNTRIVAVVGCLANAPI